MVEVRLFATLRKGREKVYEFASEEASDGRVILERLKIDSDEVAIYLINGRHSGLDDPIKDEDVIAIFPAVGGG